MTRATDHSVVQPHRRCIINKLSTKIAVGFIAAGLAIPTSIAAAGADDQPSTTASQPSSQQPRTGQGAHRQDWVAEVAAEAGISTEKLQSAIDAVRLKHLAARLDRAVSQGRITRARADEILARAKTGEWPKRPARANRAGAGQHGGTGRGQGEGQPR